MEASKEPIRMDLVSRAITFGLALVATSLIFTSVAVAFTAGATGAASGRGIVAQAQTSSLPGA
jgi:hypothetical protein